MYHLTRCTTLAFVLLMLNPLNLVRADDGDESVSKFNTEIEKQSYALGAAIVQNISKPSSARESNFAKLMRDMEEAKIDPALEIDLRVLLDAMQAAFNEEDLAMSKKELNESWAALNLTLQQTTNKKRSEAFLNENAQKEGVIVTDSGLQYTIIEAGTGARPKATDRVKVHYTGTFIDGETFDSSVDRGSPAVFPANQLIAGWTEALQLMQVGAKWQLAIPSDLAYGQRGAGSSIPPNTALLFDLELIEIVE